MTLLRVVKMGCQVLRIVTKDECSKMSALKEELHTNGSRRILILEDVSAIDRRILAKIQHERGSQYVSLTSEQPRTRKHEHSIQLGESFGIANSVFLAETIESAAVDGLHRWRSNDCLYETARTRLGYHLSVIRLGITSSKGGELDLGRK